MVLYSIVIVKMKLKDTEIRELQCPICKDIDEGFTIFPNIDSQNRLIKWDCGHCLYKDGTITTSVKKPTSNKGT